MSGSSIVQLPASEKDTEGRFSLVRAFEEWYPLGWSKEFGAKPVSRRILDVPLCVFRTSEGPVVLLDRCPHRNVPLSMGSIQGDRVECAYHGWQFDKTGTCRHIPALCGPSEGKARRVDCFPVREQDGLVWVYMRANQEPKREPFRLQESDDPSYARIAYADSFEATLYGTLENILDVPHTAFLHKGLFRGDSKRTEIEVEVQRGPRHAQAEYIGEPRPKGLMGRILAPGGGEVTHFDRFILPSIAQVEYRLGKHHVLVSSLCAPVSNFETRMYAVVLANLPVGLRMLKGLFMPIALKVVGQDKTILAAQTKTTTEFGGERFVSSQVDVLGPQILRLLKRAERGETDSGESETEQRFRMLV